MMGQEVVLQKLKTGGNNINIRETGLKKGIKVNHQIYSQLDSILSSFGLYQPKIRQDINYLQHKQDFLG